jgi:uncharacterized protein
VKDINDLLQNYYNLVAKVDSLCTDIMKQCADSLSCRKGCDACCRHFSIFWVEAVSLAKYVANLPRKQAAFLRAKAQNLSGQDVCPLLENGVCTIYETRPIICRTHGLPILTRGNTKHIIDFCPRNFTQVETIPGHLVIDLDQLTTTLVAINALFVSCYFNGDPPPTERLTIADALFLKI